MTLRSRSSRTHLWGAVVAPCLLAASVPPFALAAFETAAWGAPPAAAAPTCGGLPATRVGTPETNTLRGTSGDDVIVSGGAFVVDAMGGADRICVTGRTDYVSAGDGDDHVTTDDRAVDTLIGLGDGADTFVGGARRDHVESGAGADRVETGVGADSYDSGERFEGEAPNEDPSVDLGSGNDWASVDFSNLAGSLDGGTGLNTLSMSAECCDGEGRAWVVSNLTETATADGEPRFQWNRFRSFSFGPYDLTGTIDFEGTDAAEHVVVGEEFARHPDIVRLDMRGGNDEVVYAGTVGPVDAGEGVDWVRVVAFADERSPEAWAGAVKVDLARDRLRADGRAVRIRDVENVEVSDFVRAVLRGDELSNHLVVGQTCVAKLHGRAGADTLWGRVRSDHCAGFVDGPRTLRAFGGRGPDTMSGRWTADRLVGGRGLDTANGRNGTDVCVAETRRRCER